MKSMPAAIHAGTMPAGSGSSRPGGVRAYRALVLEAGRLRSAGDAGCGGPRRDHRSACLAPGRVAALWLAAPGTGPSGGRLAVAVTESAATGEPR